MEKYQFWVLVGMLAAGFGWIITWLRSIDKDMNELKNRMTIIETVLSMMGAPIKLYNKKGE